MTKALKRVKIGANFTFLRVGWGEISPFCDEISFDFLAKILPFSCHDCPVLPLLSLFCKVGKI